MDEIGDFGKWNKVKIKRHEIGRVLTICEGGI